MQRHSAHLEGGIIHGWTDVTAFRQLAITLTDADDSFTCQVVEPVLYIGPVI